MKQISNTVNITFDFLPPTEYTDEKRQYSFAL